MEEGASVFIVNHQVKIRVTGHHLVSNIWRRRTIVTDRSLKEFLRESGLKSDSKTPQQHVTRILEILGKNRLDSSISERFRESGYEATIIIRKRSN